MRPVRTLALLAAFFLAPAVAEAAPPRGRPAPRPSLEIRGALRTVTEPRPSTEHVLRELPTAVEPPGAYVRVTRWVEEVTHPRRDGRPKVVVVTVPGGLGLAWSRRW
jgi:hypothetical protein